MNLLDQKAEDAKVEQGPDDKITRFVDKACDTEEMSPMNAPEAYDPPAKEDVAYEDYHPLIQKMLDEHREIEDALKLFEAAIAAIESEGVTKEADEALCAFFHFVDETIHPHSEREDRTLFPVLHQRLLTSGEHSTGLEQTTAVDVLEDDHVKITQITAVAFNMFGLSSRLPDVRSRAIVLDVALNQSKALIEMLRIHIFREDHIAFPLAHQQITREEFEGMQ